LRSPKTLALNDLEELDACFVVQSDFDETVVALRLFLQLERAPRLPEG
jgi:hypothetical protein